MRRLTIALFVLALLAGGLGWLMVDTRAGQNWLLPRLVDAAMRQTPIQAFDGLRVFMCGTSSPLPSSDRAQACVAILAGDDLFLVGGCSMHPAVFYCNISIRCLPTWRARPTTRGLLLPVVSEAQ